MGDMFSLALFLFGVLISAVAVRYGIVASHKYGVVDKPGGHKLHDTVTPFVGGFGVMSSTLCSVAVVAYFFPRFGVHLDAFIVGALVLFVTGFADDMLHLNYRIRFVIQAAVGLLMIFWGQVEISDLGRVGWRKAFGRGAIIFNAQLPIQIGRAHV